MNAQDALHNFINTEFAENIGLPMPAADEPLLSSAGGVVDSLGLQKLILFLEDELGVEVLDEDIQPDNFETLTALYAYVDSRSPSSESPSTDAPSTTEAGG